MQDNRAVARPRSKLAEKVEPGLPGCGGLWERAVLRREGCREVLEALRGMGAVLTRRDYERGEVIHVTGEEAGSLCILEEGAVRLYGGYASRSRAAFSLIAPGEIFGNPVFAGGLRTASAEAFTRCEVVKVPRPFLERAIRERRETAFLLATLLESTLEEHGDLVSCLLPRRTAARLAKLLPILAAKFGGGARGEELEVGLRLTRRDLAGMIGATRESVNHAMAGLGERGVVSMERGRVTILDPEALAAVGDG